MNCVIQHFYRSYLFVIAISFVSLIIAGLAEGIGVAALLPLLGALTGGDASLPQPFDEILSSLASFIGVSLGPTALVGFVGGLILVRVMLNFCVMLYVGRVSAGVAADFRTKLIQSFAQARWNYFVSQSSGTAANALSVECNQASRALLSICQLLAGLTQAVIYMGIAVLISWQATAFALLVGLVIVGALGWFITLTRRNSQQRTATRAAMVGRLVDSLNNMKTLKAMGAEDRSVRLFERDIIALRHNSVVMIALKQGMEALHEGVKVLALIGIFLLLLGTGAYSLEQIAVVAVLFLRMIQNIGKMQKDYQSLVSVEGPFNHIQSLIQRADDHKESSGGDHRPTLEKELRLENVSFSYGDNAVLAGADLTIPAGALVCLSGPSGSGKTTLVDLICGLIQPQVGDILLDGVAMSRTDISAWRQMIGYVPQELMLFHDTLLTNVTLGEERYSRADAEAALRAANAWDFVSRLPLGMDTMVGERGMMFSGGQRQRIALARALVRKPRLLILDEVTAALDPEAEQEICSTLDRLRGQTTMVAATHQTALTMIADATYAVKEGTCRKAQPGCRRQ